MKKGLDGYGATAIRTVLLVDPLISRLTVETPETLGGTTKFTW